APDHQTSHRPTPPFAKGGPGGIPPLRVTPPTIRPRTVPLPPLTRGAGGDSPPLPTRLQHPRQLPRHLPVVEADHPQPQRLQRSGALAVVFDGFRRMVLGTVQFDDQLRRGTVEIDDVASQRFLPVELQAAQLLAAQAGP